MGLQHLKKWLQEPSSHHLPAGHKLDQLFVNIHKICPVYTRDFLEGMQRLWLRHLHSLMR